MRSAEASRCSAWWNSVETQSGEGIAVCLVSTTWTVAWVPRGGSTRRPDREAGAKRARLTKLEQSNQASTTPRVT